MFFRELSWDLLKSPDGRRQHGLYPQPKVTTSVITRLSPFRSILSEIVQEISTGSLAAIGGEIREWELRQA